MNTFLQLSIIGSITTTLAMADVTSAQIRNLENRVSALEQRKSPNNVITPVGRPEVRDGADIFLMVDFLYWQPHEAGLGYVVQSNQDGLAGSVTKELDYNWDPGVRIGLGWNTPHDGWDINATWTYYHSKADSETNKDQGTLYPTFGSEYVLQDTFMNPNSAHGKWRLNLNLADLELGREFFVSRWLTLRPFIGARSAWVYQYLNVNYDHTYYPYAVLKQSPFISYKIRNKCGYWGLGIRPGIDTQWGLGGGWSLFGNTAVSLLYGFFEQTPYEYTQITRGPKQTYVKNHHSTRLGTAILESKLGIQWETMSSQDRVHFSIQAGWDQWMFFGFNQFDRFLGHSSVTQATVLSSQGNLTLQGYSLAFRLDF